MEKLYEMNRRDYGIRLKIRRTDGEGRIKETHKEVKKIITPSNPEKENYVTHHTTKENQ